MVQHPSGCRRCPPARAVREGRRTACPSSPQHCARLCRRSGTTLGCAAVGVRGCRRARRRVAVAPLRDPPHVAPSGRSPPRLVCPDPSSVAPSGVCLFFFFFGYFRLAFVGCIVYRENKLYLESVPVHRPDWNPLAHVRCRV